MFFVLQGKAIEQCIEKNILFTALIRTLIGFVITKCLVMSADLLKQFVIANLTNREIAGQWQHCFPERLFRDNTEKGDTLCLLYFDYLPNAFRLEMTIIDHHYTILSVGSILMLFLILNQFFLGLMIASILFGFAFISKKFFLKRIAAYYAEVTEQKNQTFRWLLQYLQGWREISLCWKHQLTGWAKHQYQELYMANQRLAQAQLLRDITTQCFVEIPFVLNTSAMVIGIYFGYLTITQFFVWIGISQFIIQASNAYAEKKTSYQQQQVIFRKIEETLQQFDNQNPSSLNYFNYLEQGTNVTEKRIIESSCRPLAKSQDNTSLNCDRHLKADQEVSISNRGSNLDREIMITLKDGSKSHLSLLPGIYRVEGKNGAGKTTLLNALMGFERIIKLKDYLSLKSFLTETRRENIRLIEREPILFDVFTTFNAQVLGPESMLKESSWQQIFENKMQPYLRPEERRCLLKQFRYLDKQFCLRFPKTFSSGEKVLISLMRVLLSWDEKVVVLLVDECTAFLDHPTRALFMKIIAQLSQHVAIYLTTHETNIVISQY